MQKSTRMKRELKQLQDKPPTGISCWPKENRVDQLEASKCVLQRNVFIPLSRDCQRTLTIDKSDCKTLMRAFLACSLGYFKWAVSSGTSGSL